LADRAAAAFAAYREGDRERMGELVDLLTPILWHTARGQRLDQATSEDVIQTAWIRLVEGAEAIADGRSIPVEEFPETEPDGLLAALDPAAEAMLREDQRVLWRAVSSLSERCQALLRIIAFIDRPDYGAVSEALGMPVGSIGPTRGRCLAKLRGQLAADPTWSTP
jgi:DNA-directed RNA polymerase specialized sigma24 family protein